MDNNDKMSLESIMILPPLMLRQNHYKGGFFIIKRC